MKRMVTYLYEYQNGMKGVSAGFLKLDSRGNDCRIQLCLQGRNAREDHGLVYFVVKQDKPVGILLGEVMMKQGTIGGSWIVNQESICGSRWTFSDVEGMAVRYPSGRYLASSWIEKPDEEFLRGLFENWNGHKSLEAPDRTEQPPKQTERLQLAEETKRVEELQQAEKTWQAEKPQPLAENLETVQEQIEDRIGMEQPGQDRTKIEETDELSTMQADLVRASEAARPLVHTTERIDISDIRKLPKKNWHLCSNSFVIHGFFNYHYLVCIHREEEGMSRRYLGVPGIYAKPERAMAMLFGFPEFEALRDLDMKGQSMKNQGIKEETVGEEVPEGTFGYWCCQLEM